MLALGLLIGIAPVGTMASWQASATVNPGSFVSGVLDLRLRDASTTVGQGGTIANAELTSVALLPGESVAASIALRNDGTGPFAWTAAATANGVLAGGLRFSTYPGGVASNSTSTTGIRTASCSGTVATSNVTLSTSTTPVVMNPQALAASGSTTVCVLMALPANAVASYAGTSASVSYVFSATQVAPS